MEVKTKKTYNLMLNCTLPIIHQAPKSTKRRCTAVAYGGVTAEVRRSRVDGRHSCEVEGSVCRRDGLRRWDRHRALMVDGCI